VIYIRGVAVRQDMQGKGLGTALDLELHIVPRSKMKPGDLEDIF